MSAVIDKIAGDILRLEKELSACTRCGTCLTVCPVYQTTGREADVARGKLALLDALAGKLFETPKGVTARLDRCLLCGACARKCPAGVKVLEIFSAARFILKTVKGLSSVHRAALRKILAEPPRFDRALRTAAKIQSSLLGSAWNDSETLSIPIGPARFRDRRLVPLASVSFLDRIRNGELIARSKETLSGPRVVFFSGCLSDKFFPEIAVASAKTLSAAGVHLIIPTEQGCCGMPAVSLGDLASFGRLVRYHVELLAVQPFDYLVTACATCAAMIKTLWPKLTRSLSEELAARAGLISEKTMEISQFFANVTGIPEKHFETAATPIRVTYHDPCHLSGALGVSEAPRQLIRANPRYRLVEMETPDSCCGMGGIFNLKHYDLSRDIGARKREKILATGADMVVTSCPACILQLKDQLSDSHPQIKVRHVMEL